MRFLADMGVSQRVVDWLRATGHDAVHLREEGLQRLPNGEIFQKAFQEQSIVLTFDLDFGEILAASAGQMVSVILFRLRNTRADFVIARLDPAYLQIIGMGQEALPLLVHELRREPDHWFVALQAITGTNPIPPSARGKVDAMTRAWLDWAEKRGL